MGNGGKEEVRAAGGVVVREGRKGPKIVLVHRPSYDDWSLPKGKLEEGESFEEGALREVEEETGLVCELGRELSPVRYDDRKGRPKVVRYWEMRTLSGEFKESHEVDEMRWLSPAKASKALDYEHDRKLVAELFAQDD